MASYLVPPELVDIEIGKQCYLNRTINGREVDPNSEISKNTLKPKWLIRPKIDMRRNLEDTNCNRDVGSFCTSPLEFHSDR